MKEGRKTRAPRYLVSEGAVIKFGDRTIGCVVRNLSATGAAVEVPNEPGIPSKFALSIPRFGIEHGLSGCMAQRSSDRRCIHCDMMLSEDSSFR